MSAGGSVTEHRYGAREDQLLSLHRPAEGANSPVVVAVHGGAWRTGDRSLMETTAVGLATRGVAVASIEYRQRQPDPVADMVADIAEAVAWVRTTLVAPDPRERLARVALLGDSAGAHAALLAVLRGAGPTVDALVSLCGALDLSELRHPRDDDQRRRFTEYRATISGDDDARLDAVDPARVRRRLGRGVVLPPLFAATSAADFFSASTLSYVRLARDLGDDVTLHAVGPEHPECRHSWQLDAGLAETTRLFDAVAGWLRR